MSNPPTKNVLPSRQQPATAAASAAAAGQLTDARMAAQEQQTVSDSYLLWMIGRFLAPYWWQLLCILLMLLGITAMSLIMPFLIQQAVDGPIAHQQLDGLLPYGLAYFAAILALFILRLAQTYWLQTVGQNALLNLRQKLFEHILKQDMRFFSHTPVGQIVSRMSNDIEALTELLSTSFVIIVSNLITLAGIIIVMLLINWQLALLSLSVLPLMIIGSYFFRKRIRLAARRYHQFVAEYLAFLNEQFNGMIVVQLFGRQRLSRQQFQRINGAIRDSHNGMRDLYTLYASVLQFLTSVGLGLVLYGGGSGVLAGWATLGTLIAFIEYSRRSFEPIIQLSEQFAQIQTALSAGERIARMLRVESEIVDPEHPAKVEQFTPTIQFEHVHFRYNDDMPVLVDLDLRVEAGQRVAIVGATGAGKTSLAKLLARFYDVQEGRVLISGVDVRELSTEDLRRFVTVVPQNPYCFNGTIADNLRLFNPTISDEQMIAAARAACAAPFIEKLPEQYNYKLLPGGANLSEGQRQLLALARALLHSPESILVLDEATSSIDTETEALIQEGLQRVLANRTSLIIAHRLSTVRDADRILVMQRGKIVEDGTHDQLLALNGVYAQLYRRQFMEIEAHEVLPPQMRMAGAAD